MLLRGNESVLLGNGAPLRVKLHGAKANARAEALDPQPGKTSQFQGRVPERWIADAPTCKQVRFREVYPGIDVLYYGADGQIESDFVIAPGADPSRIELAFEGIEHLDIDQAGDLVATTQQGGARWRKPVIYQEANGRRIKIEGRYLLRGKRKAAFQVAAYDPSRKLVIDPILSYATFFGGTGNDAVKSVAVDPAGNVYLSGFTSTFSNFPITPNSFQTAFKGQGPYLASLGDVFVAKLDPNGALVYCTYIGGTDDEGALGMAVDRDGAVYLTGFTRSGDYPVTAGALKTTYGGTPSQPIAGEAFVTKLSPAGNRLVYSTFLGGTEFDSGAAIAVDGVGNAYVTGQTTSPNFPVTANSLQTSYRGGVGTRIFTGEQFTTGDVFVSKLDASGARLIYSTFLGGSADEIGLGIAVDSAGNAYVTGFTSSTNFPTVRPFQATYGGGGGQNNFTFGDAFLSKLDPTGANLVYSTYLGGRQDDIAFGIAVDSTGSAYVTGSTLSNNFPIVGGFQSGYRGAGGETVSSAGDCFVTKFRGDGSGLVYSTYLGGTRDERCTAIAVDSAGNAWVTGSTLSTDFPLTADAAQRTFGGAGGVGFSLISFGDAFASKLDASGARLVYSTYLGGEADELGLGVAVDAAGLAYVVGSTRSNAFPATAGALSRRYGGFSGEVSGYLLGDGFFAKFSEPRITAVVNGASFGTGPAAVAPGSIIAIAGSGLAAQTAVASALPLPTALSGASVAINGRGRRRFTTRAPLRSMRSFRRILRPARPMQW